MDGTTKTGSLWVNMACTWSNWVWVSGWKEDTGGLGLAVCYDTHGGSRFYDFMPFSG